MLAAGEEMNSKPEEKVGRRFLLFPKESVPGWYICCWNIKTHFIVESSHMHNPDLFDPKFIWKNKKKYTFSIFKKKCQTLLINIDFCGRQNNASRQTSIF